MSAIRQPDPSDPAPERLRLQLVEQLAEQEDHEAAGLRAEIDTAIAQASRVEITSDETRDQVAAMLQQIQAKRQDLERRRRHLKQPHLEGGRRVDRMFRDLQAPLDAADGVLRPKLIEWEDEKARVAAAEQARLDAERRRREEAAAEEQRKAAAEAQAAREAAAREAAAADAAARKAEEKRAQLERSDDELAAAAAAAPEETLQSAAGRQDRFGEVARAELETRQAQREAREAAGRQAAAAQAEEEARQAEEAARSAPVPVLPRAEVAVQSVSQATGGAISRPRRREVSIPEPDRVPRTIVIDGVEHVLMQPAMGTIRRLALAGVEIPGVKVDTVEGLAVRAS